MPALIRISSRSDRFIYRRIIDTFIETYMFCLFHLQIITFIGAGICDMPEISAGKSTYTGNQQVGGKNQYPLRNLFLFFVFA